MTETISKAAGSVGPSVDRGSLHWATWYHLILTARGVLSSLLLLHLSGFMLSIANFFFRNSEVSSFPMVATVNPSAAYFIDFSGDLRLSHCLRLSLPLFLSLKYFWCFLRVCYLHLISPPLWCCFVLKPQLGASKMHDPKGHPLASLRAPLFEKLGVVCSTQGHFNMHSGPGTQPLTLQLMDFLPCQMSYSCPSWAPERELLSSPVHEQLRMRCRLSLSIHNSLVGYSSILVLVHHRTEQDSQTLIPPVALRRDCVCSFRCVLVSLFAPTNVLNRSTLLTHPIHPPIPPQKS